MKLLILLVFFGIILAVHGIYQENFKKLKIIKKLNIDSFLGLIMMNKYFLVNSLLNSVIFLMKIMIIHLLIKEHLFLIK